MAFDPKPSSWIASWSEDATNITIPIASLTGLTADHADGTTGDVRECVLSILETLYAAYAATAAADRPGKMTITKGASYPSAGVFRQVFSFSIDTALTGSSVVDE
jgi:hypothetical protein